jgi:hypothetical protein
MNDLASLIQIVLAAIVVAAPVVLFVRLVAGSETRWAVGLFYHADDRGWPRGVQEEEPVAWGIAPARS